jgi:hypothetical protein
MADDFACAARLWLRKSRTNNWLVDKSAKLLRQRGRLSGVGFSLEMMNQLKKLCLKPDDLKLTHFELQMEEQTVKRIEAEEGLIVENYPF